ncbi:MAG: hypothetical protein MK171_11915 [Pirellulales bacterium]|nr:hypothetical protein [Pirellulales bacterium]
MPPPTTPHFREDYDQMTLGCGRMALEDWEVVSITGQDRAKFLHNMCTNDINRLSSGDGCEAFCTDVKGKIVAHGIVVVLEDSLQFVVTGGGAGPLLDHLDRYIVREDVVLQNATDEHEWTFISGRQSAAVVGRLTGDDLAAPSLPWQSVIFCQPNQDGLVVRAGLIWPESFLVRCPRGEVQESWPADCTLVGDDSAWNALRIESSLPLFGTDFSSAHFPQEVARDDQTISFNKGCYLGQETIARIDALGHVNRQVTTVRFDRDAQPAPGVQLLKEDQVVGEITSACWSPRYERPLALAMVRRGSNKPGDELHSNVGAAVVL